MDVASIREDFPVTRNCIYLDNASLSPIPCQVVSAVSAQLNDRCQRGVNGFWDWLSTMDATRALIASLINAQPEEIAFTQNTSEGINIVASTIDWHQGDNVITNDLEYFPNVYPWLNLRRRGVEVRIARHREGLIEFDDLRRLVDERTRVLALSHVAWINGLRHDLSTIGAFCRSQNILFCVDAIQSVGALPVDVVAGNVDFLACGGHKWLLAPLGTGFLFCRKELIRQYAPPFVGWQSDDRPLSSQDYEFRDEFRPGDTARRFNHGNSNMAGVHGLHASLVYMTELGWDAIFARNRQLAALTIERLSGVGVKFLSPLAEQSRSSIVNFIPRDLNGMMQALKASDIVVSSRAGGVRVSPAFYNTEVEIERLVDIIRRCESR